MSRRPSVNNPIRGWFVPIVENHFGVGYEEDWDSSYEFTDTRLANRHEIHSLARTLARTGKYPYSAHQLYEILEGMVILHNLDISAARDMAKDYIFEHWAQGLRP